MTQRVKRKLIENLQIWLLLVVPVVFGFAIFYLIPKIDAILLAFRGYDKSGRLVFVGLDNFKAFFEYFSKSANDPTVKTALLNSPINFIFITSDTLNFQPHP